MGPAAPNRRWLALALVVAAAACWASSGFWVNRVLVGGRLTAISLAFWRDLSTAACLWLLLALWRRDLMRVRRRDLPWLAVMGMASIGIFHALWNASVMSNGVAVATILQYNAPIVVTVVAWLWWREPITWRKVAAILLALAGTVLISRLDGLGGQQITAAGLAIGLASALTFSGLALFGKRLSGDYHAVTILAYAFAFGALALLPLNLAWGGGPAFGVGALFWFAGLILVATLLGFGLYTTALRHLQASVAAIVATIEVLFAALIAYLTLGERLDGVQVLGGFLIMGGVVLVSWPRRRRLRRERAS